MSSIGRPLMPPDLLMRSTAICVPTSAVLPPAAAAPESGCSVPILYGLACPKAACHGAGTSMLAPSAPAAAEPYPINRRRVTLPRYQNASLQFCVFASSVIVSSSQIDCNGADTRHQLPLSECAAHRPASLGQEMSWRFVGYFRTPAPTTSGRVSRACLWLEVKPIPTLQVGSRFSARRLMIR